MTFDELMSKVLELLPNAEIGEDNDGQLIVYTGLRDNGSEIVPFDPA